MTHLPECRTVFDAVELMISSAAWRYRHVELRFPGGDCWVHIYPLFGQSDPYFDFAYTDREPPEKRLASLLGEFEQGQFIDWCDGRLACLRIKGASKEQLVSAISRVAEDLFAQSPRSLDVYYEHETPA
jgi:hypothetical protein